jgi:GGDEF domain-containing protein
MICCYNKKGYSENVKSSVYPIIGDLAKLGYTLHLNDERESVCEKLRGNPSVSEFAVVDNGIVKGFTTRAALNRLMLKDKSGRLRMKKNMVDMGFLRVNYNMPVDQVSRLAMQRNHEQIYNPIVVEKDRKYMGMVTIRDLLNACTKVEVEALTHSNPLGDLTGLPGSLLIEREIVKRVYSTEPYCITYYDIDNFKAYNNAYGFRNGDKMLSLLVAVLKDCAVNNEFIGHIGGDDFIVICDYHDGVRFCEAVIKQFSQRVMSLYRGGDVENGFILSKNWNGVTETFPIASLSVAGISNKNRYYMNIEDFSRDMAQLKKKCKRQMGNYCEVI